MGYVSVYDTGVLLIQRESWFLVQELSQRTAISTRLGSRAAFRKREFPKGDGLQFENFWLCNGCLSQQLLNSCLTSQWHKMNGQASLSVTHQCIAVYSQS